MTTDDSGDPKTFEELGLGPELLNTLNELGYEEPTPIQTEALPIVLAGHDVLGQAATGTGKTAAFALPLLEMLGRNDKRGKAPLGLVLTPTRELAIQVCDATHRYGRGIKARVLPIYGGQPIQRQLRALNDGVDIVVATPGRALDHIKRGTLKLHNISMVVLDEADEMLDMGFAEDLEAILSATPEDRQTVLFSATMPRRIDDIAKRHQKDPIQIRIKREESTSDGAPLVRQVAYIVNRGHKAAALGRVLDVESPDAAIVFCRTRNEVDQLSEILNGRGYRAEALHGGLSQEARDRVMNRLRNKVADLLIATDVAARGLDVDHLTHVVNYDVPQSTESYVHRIGRVGRAGREGVAITLADPRERRLLKNVERVTKSTIAIEKVPTVADLHSRRLEITRATLVETLLDDEDNENFHAVLEALTTEYDIEEIALAAIRIAHEATSPDADQREIPDMSAKGAKGDSRPDRGGRPNRDDRGNKSHGAKSGANKHQSSEGMTRLYVSAGRNAGIRPADLVGAFAGESQISGKQIGSIQITDRFSLVEVPDSAADDVIQAMRGVQLRGKKITVRRERF